jgi:hypothetical protein
MALDTDIVLALHELRRRTIAQFVLRRAKVEWRHLRRLGRRLGVLTEERTGVSHWRTDFGLHIHGDHAVCGQAVGAILYDDDGRVRPIDCPRCLKLLRRVGGQKAEDVQLLASLKDGAAPARGELSSGATYHFDEGGGAKSTPPRGG